MYKILVSDSISEEGLKVLQDQKEFQVDINTKLTPEQLKEIIKDYDALLVRSATKVTKDVIEAGKKLKVIGRAGVGVDNVDVAQATKQGVIVMNTPEGNTISTAEHTVSMLLSLSRNIPQANLSVKALEWDRKSFTGVELFGKVLGIVGLGRIGSEVAKRANSFGMQILAYDPYLSVEKARQLNIEISDLNELLSKSDFISVHVPLTQDTKHMISAEQFKLMKYGVRIINCARGGIIDEAALEQAIKEGKVAGAALDVFEKEPPVDSPLLKHKCVIATPHIGASTEEAQLNVAIEVAHQVRDYFITKSIKNAVNAPSVEPALLKEMEPYIKLAEKMGAMGVQLVEGNIEFVSIRYNGELINLQLSPVTVAMIKGMLTVMHGETVNYVNASMLAKERGIRVLESKSAQIDDFANLITLEIKTTKTTLILMATLFTKKDPRIVKINQFFVDVVPEGYMVVIYNRDVPGIVGHVGNVMGNNKINIAGMTFGREKQGGKAITVLNVDSHVTKDVLDEIKKCPDVTEAKLIKL